MKNSDLKCLLSTNIKRYRSLKKLSQSDFAEKINISIPFLSDIENGKKWVSHLTLEKIAAALNIEAYELLKPESALPDCASNIIEKYTEDINKSISLICKKYVTKLQRKQ